MFTGRKHDALSDERGRVTAMSNVLDRCRDLEVVEIRSNKDVSSIRGRGSERDVNVDAGVQSNAGDLDRFCKRCLFHLELIDKQDTIAVPRQKREKTEEIEDNIHGCVAFPQLHKQKSNNVGLQFTIQS